MNHTNPPFSTEKSPNPPPNEDYIYDLSNSFSINEIFNNDFNSSEIDESENLYNLIMIKPKSNNKDKIIFKTEKLQKKRGRKRNKESKKDEHTSWSIDNIIVKVQAHFLDFMISFLNDCVHSFPETQKYTFLKLDRGEKKKVSKKQMDKMKNSTIKDLLEKVKISKKYKQYDENTNKSNLDALMEESWLRQIFHIKFSDLFFYYYNNEQPLKDLTIFGKKLILSKTTESFIALLQKDKNKIMEDKIVEYTKEIYFDGKNPSENA
jgi:hypothetical protein